MKTLTRLAIVSTLALAAFAVPSSSQDSKAPSSKAATQETMQLGNFSVSLAVKDIKASKAFYEMLDFKEVGGNIEQNWLVLQNGTTTIGLFQGMFERNLMTFNPGWDHNKETPKDFQDVRELQAVLKERGMKFTTEADMASKGPASFVLTDPDGNPVLFDQHVPKPKD